MLAPFILVLAVAQAGAPPATPARLIEAAKLGQLDVARTLATPGTSVDATDRRGFTALSWAAASGHLAIVTLLIERGAWIGRPAFDGTTPLMLAAANGHLVVVRTLLARGANVAAATPGGTTARQLAERQGHTEVVTLLEQAEAAGQRLLQAARDGNDGVVRQMLVLGAPANVADARGVTPLMLLARAGNLGALQFLLARGADPAVGDVDGRTAWDWAELSADTGKFVTAYFLERGLVRTRHSTPTAAPPPTIIASLRAIETALNRLPPASPALRAAKQRADRALAQLNRLSARWPAESPADYRADLAATVDILNGLVGTDSAAAAATVQAVAEDLEVKLEHCNRSGGALGGSVTVRVRTLQSGQEIKSWQVFYLPKIFEAAASADPDLFPQLSSPTEERLVPGRYVMWVRDPSTSRLGERTVVKVGEGRRELLLELPVPAEAAR